MRSPRRLALIALGGTVLGLLGSAAASSAVVLFLTFGVLVGGSTGLGYATAVRVAGTVASGRGLALGLVVSAYAAGTAVLAPIASALLAERGSSRDLRRARRRARSAARHRGPARPGASTRPARRGTPAPTCPPGGPSSPSGWPSASAARRPSRPSPRPVASRARGAVALAVTLLNLGNFAGRLIAGPLSDRIGRRAALHANRALLVLACIPLAIGASGALALAALLVLGTQYGALSTLTPAATSDVVPAERFGSTYGLVFTSWGLAGLAAPVLAAPLLGGRL